MRKPSLRKFAEAIETNNYPQIGGYLFGLGKKTGKVYGCALGQGLLNIGAITEEEVIEALTKSSNPVKIKGAGEDVAINAELESLFTDMVTNWFGDEFHEFVTTRNDGDGLSVTEIGKKVVEISKLSKLRRENIFEGNEEFN